MPKIVQQTMKPVVKAKTGNSFLDGIVPVDQLPQSGRKLLITGPPNSGKTTLGCSAPKPLCYIRPEQVEDGSLSIRTVKGVFATPQMTLDSQLGDVVARQRETREWATIFLDGVHFYQDLILKRVLGLKEVPAQLSWGIATQQDWGTVGQELKEGLRSLLQLAASEEDGGTKTNIIISGGERTINDDNAIIPPSIVVSLTPSAAGWLNFVCDFIVSCYSRPKQIQTTMKIGDQDFVTTEKDPSGEIEYCARTIPTDIYLAKFKVPKGTKLPPVVVDPNWEKLSAFMKGISDAGTKSKA